MKRRLSLLLAMVLAMTMVMGIGVTAMAAQSPAWNNMPTECTCTEHTSAALHVYVTGETYAHPLETDVQCAEGIIFATNDITMECYADGPAYGYYDFPVSMFETPFERGWYYSNDEFATTLYKCTSSAPLDDPTPSGSSPAHVHNFKWQTITAPTKDADGLEGEMCSCGAVRNTQPLSAYGYALNEYATPMINAAKSGQTITFEFGEWNSFPKSFMAKLVDKSAQNVTFVFKYKWNHKLQTITIPAGTPIDLNFDWYGPAKMTELYGAY